MQLKGTRCGRQRLYMTVVVVREMGHSISGLAKKFRFTRATIYTSVSGKTKSPTSLRPGKHWTNGAIDNCRESKRDRRAALSQIAEDFNGGEMNKLAWALFNGLPWESTVHALACTVDFTGQSLRVARVRKHRHWTVYDWKHVCLVWACSIGVRKMLSYARTGRGQRILVKVRSVSDE